MKQLATTVCHPVGMLNDMDHLFDRLFNTSVKAPSIHGFYTDITETEEGYLVQAELPGFLTENVDVRIEDNVLIIEAKSPETTTESAREDSAWFVRERYQGNRRRSFALPDNVDKSSIEAELRNGILTVELKKSPEAKPFSIKVKG